MSTRAPLAPEQSSPGHVYTRGFTTTAPDAVDVLLLPPFDATAVLVSRLLSSVAMTSTFLLAALGVLMFPNRTFGPPPVPLQLLNVPSVDDAVQATVGIR